MPFFKKNVYLHLGNNSKKHQKNHKMKRLGLLMMSIAALAMTSCSALQSAASSNTVANASGQACGSAVQGLYKSYKKSGSIDITSGSDLTNALQLATAYSQLKQNKKDKSYRKAFTSGLISSSAGLITSQNASSFINQMLSISGLSNINASNVTQTASTAASIISLLSTLKQ